MRRKYKIEKREASIFIKSSVSDSFPEIKEILSRNKIYPFLTNKEYSNLNDTDKTFIDKKTFSDDEFLKLEELFKNTTEFFMVR